MVFQFPLLSLTTLAAATPPGIEVEITDENVESLPPEDDADLVAITAMTPLAPRAYEIADRYRARGVPVVLGGVHPTWRPEEAARHADAVVRGEGDWIWTRVIADFQRGALAPIYEDRARPRLEDLRVPRWDLLRDKPYFFTNTLQTSRGCPHDCDFCSVTASHGRKYRTKPLEQVAREIEACNGGKGFLFIVDDNVIGHRDHAWRLFRLLDSYTLKWLSHATVDLAWDLPLLRECARSGCHGLFVGFESLSQRCLDAMGKRTNAAARYFEAVDRFHDAGIGVEGAFIFGNDDDDIRVFEATVEFVDRAGLDGVHFSILTPYPGTRAHQTLESQGRIFDRDWSHYDLARVVFRPAKMTPAQLQEGFYWAWRHVYSLPSIWRRLIPPRRSFQVFGPMNIGFRISSHRAGFHAGVHP